MGTDAIGISAMMHGYIALDGSDSLLVPFRTWRNTMTGEASEVLSDLMDFNIPQRWTIAHLGQAILRCEEHLKRLGFLCMRRDVSDIDVSQITDMSSSLHAQRCLN